MNFPFSIFTGNVLTNQIFHRSYSYKIQHAWHVYKSILRAFFNASTRHGLNFQHRIVLVTFIRVKMRYLSSLFNVTLLRSARMRCNCIIKQMTSWEDSKNTGTRTRLWTGHPSILQDQFSKGLPSRDKGKLRLICRNYVLINNHFSDI